MAEASDDPVRDTARQLLACAHPTAANQRAGATGARGIVDILGAEALGILANVVKRLDRLPRGLAELTARVDRILNFVDEALNDGGGRHG